MLGVKILTEEGTMEYNINMLEQQQPNRGGTNNIMLGAIIF